MRRKYSKEKLGWAGWQWIRYKAGTHSVWDAAIFALLTLTYLYSKNDIFVLKLFCKAESCL